MKTTTCARCLSTMNEHSGLMSEIGLVCDACDLQMITELTAPRLGPAWLMLAGAAFLSCGGLSLSFRHIQTQSVTAAGLQTLTTTLGVDTPALLLALITLGLCGFAARAALRAQPRQSAPLFRPAQVAVIALAGLLTVSGLASGWHARPHQTTTQTAVP